MKLSAMNTRELKCALCTIAAPIAAIAKDEAFVGAMQSMAQARKNNVTVGELAAVFMAEVVPLLLEKREHETFTILAVLTGKTYDEIMEQNGMQTIRDIKNSVDGALLDFFR